MTHIESIIFGIIIIGLIIAFHEFGHFIVAKKNGIGVTEFSVGFGPRLFTKVYHGTRYSIKAIPIGGCCQMLGDDNGIPDPEITETKNRDDSFLGKPVWVRIAVIFAGPFFNFVLAFFAALMVIGIAGVDKPLVMKSIEDYPAYEAGIREGDVITKLNHTTIYTARDISLFMDEYKAGDTVDVTIKRDGEKINCTIVPKWSEEYNKYMIGISWNAGMREKVGPIATIGYSFNEVGYWIRLTFKSLGMLFTGGASVNDFAGPVGIVDVIDDTVEASKPDGALYVFLNLANLCILLSANIGVMNLLPIPAMDGGRLVFLFIEAIRRKPVSREKEGYVHIAGFLLLMIFMVFIMFNDIRKLF